MVGTTNNLKSSWVWPQKVDFDEGVCIWQNGSSSRENEVKNQTIAKWPKPTELIMVLRVFLVHNQLQSWHRIKCHWISEISCPPYSVCLLTHILGFLKRGDWTNFYWRFCNIFQLFCCSARRVECICCGLFINLIYSHKIIVI